MRRTGHTFIKAKLKQTGAALAGEMSGHNIFKERLCGFDDWVYAGARLLELLSRRQESPQQIFDALPDSVNTPELRIDFEEGEHYVFMDKLKKVANFGDASVSKIDGLRVDYEDGFGLIRPSNTTPILVLRFEADSEHAIARIQADFKAAIGQVDPDLKTPF
jgi:phosphomannomutase